MIKLTVKIFEMATLMHLSVYEDKEWKCFFFYLCFFN